MKNFIPLILIILAIVSWYFYIDPKYDDVKELSAKESEYLDVLNEVERIQETRNKLVNQYNSFSNENINRLDTLLPAQIDGVRLISDIDGLASSFGIKIQNIQLSEGSLEPGRTVISSEKDRYNNVNLSFSFNARYNTFLKFLKSLEQSLRLVDVKELSFSSSEGGTETKEAEGEFLEAGPGEYQYNITLTTYWLK